ncbi:MAG: hypothetical protein P4L64_03400 [Caulobacteraceae bacterium]|nr:hypothetical protein [Caulobacteraceae bacterium]
MTRLVLSALCLTLLCACDTTGASRPPPVGASVQPIETGRYHVTYRGRSRMSQAEVEDRALLQAANQALAQGFDWFEVTDRSRSMAPATSPQFSIGLGGGGYGRGGGVGVGGATTFGGEGTYVATLEILCGHGPRPSRPEAYDAHDVVSNLGPRLR